MTRRLPTFLSAVALLSIAASARAGEPVPSAPAEVATGVAFDLALTFEQGVAKAKADSKPLFVDFWRDH